MRLATELFDAGILQYGSFQRDRESLPWVVQHEMLVSYPPLLKTCADVVAERVTFNVQKRLLCQTSALPLALLVSQITGVSLVWERGISSSPVEDFAGAYDIGHPTILICFEGVDDNATDRLLKRAEGVGLKHVATLTLFGWDNDCLLPILPLTRALFDSGRVTKVQFATIEAWINSKTPRK